MRKTFGRLAVVIVVSMFALPVFAISEADVRATFKKQNIVQNSEVSSNPASSSKPQKSGTQKSGYILLFATQSVDTESPAYIEGEVIVKFKENRTNLKKSLGVIKSSQFAARQNLSVKENIRRANLTVLKTRGKETTEQAITRLKSDPDVEYVQPNYQYYPTDISTNDTNRGVLWGLDNTGQSANGVSGTSDADIDAPEGWAISEATTSASVVVAVIDTGVAYNHPDLAANMWDGTSCIDENGAAVAGGCNYGYDYEDGDNTPLPTTSSHGTHVAGTIAAVKNNAAGIIGVAPQAKIMAIKSSLTTSNAVKSINFAAQNGARVINASWGCNWPDVAGRTHALCSGTGDYRDLALEGAIGAFPGLFVVAAGNGDGDSDTGGDNHDSEQTLHSYPCDLTLPNIICVTATDQNDSLATFSDYGATSVDVGAPGINILSTVADTAVVNEDFNSVTIPDLPSGWTKTGNWGTYDFSGDKVLYGDLALSYANNANTTATSQSINLSSANGATVSFYTQCDTEYTTTTWSDYIQLEYSADGTNFVPVSDPFFGGDFLWDEAQLDFLNGDSSSAGAAGFYFSNVSLPGSFTTNSKLRFHWITNGSDNNYDGCLIDNLTITKFSDGSDGIYGYSDGTSMAAPHVAGLAALIEGYSPSLTAAQVKNTILTTGDSLAALFGKTVSGNRINAFNALHSLVPTTLTISGTVKYYDGIKAIPDAVITLSNASTSAVIATTTTSGTGTYQFTNVLDGGNYTLSASSTDISTGGLSGADQGKIGRHIIHLELFDSIYKTIAGDVNNSGGLTGADQGKIGRFIVHLDANLPSGTWKFYSSDATLATSTYLTTGMTRNIFNATADANSQDFIGIKMGDVNNSWTSS